MKIIRKVAFIYLMAMVVGVFVSADGPIPPGFCSGECEDLYIEDQPNGGAAFQQCMEECENPQAPIDNSILHLFLAGTLLASYILLKKPKHKKPPM